MRALDLGRRHTTHAQRVSRECPACVRRWSSALCAWLASSWRVHSCVELRAQFCACTQIPTHTTNDDECSALVQRARRTSSAWRRTPSERRRTGQNCYFFSAPAVRRAGVTGALNLSSRFEIFMLFASTFWATNCIVSSLVSSYDGGLSRGGFVAGRSL